MYIASGYDAYCPMREALCILTQKIALCILPRHDAKWPISHIAHNIYMYIYIYICNELIEERF